MQQHYSQRNQTTNTLPPRQPLKVDLNHNFITIADSELPTGNSSNPDDILARYLAIIYNLRNTPIGDPISFRQLDLEVLSAALELDITETEAKLQQLVDNKQNVMAVANTFRSRFITSAAAIILAVCAGGMLVASITASPEPDTDISTAAVVTLEIVTDIGNGGAVEFNPED